jgi:hypothetical protein
VLSCAVLCCAVLCSSQHSPASFIPYLSRCRVCVLFKQRHL